MLKAFGNDLKHLRETKGITIAEIAAQTRINPKFLTNLEAGIFDFQPETYIRAFIKAYARCMDVSEGQLLTEYDKAKAGFYQPKNILKDKSATIASESDVKTIAGSNEELKPVPAGTEIPKVISYTKPVSSLDKQEYSNKGWIRKVLLGLLIIIIVLGIIYLVDYLNTSSEDKSQNIKPKSFSEISSDYESKIKGKTEDTSITKQDTLQTVISDSLKLMVVVAKETRIKVHIDEKRLVDEVLQPKDSITIYAKEQFRFSANSNASVDLYLNGKYLRKPSSITGTSIKNLIINKNGIVQ
jgi:cytoskeletal protein RodZ